MTKPYHKCLLVISLFLINTHFCSGQNDNYSRVKIYTDGAGIGKLAEQGVAFDHGEVKKDVYFISDFSAAEVEIIKASGVKYEILIEDAVKHYAEQNNHLEDALESEPSLTTCDKAFVKKPSHFHLGNYGGFFSYDEMLSILDSMQLLYPNLISKKAPINSTTTSEGRPLYWLRISNNPNVEQANKPQIFYNALHHAREPGSLSQLIYYMWYLLDNYYTDPEVKGIVDNMEMYFVPCINPDGYVYNFSTNPTGGGMHRKNRRKNSDGTFGVDINRNYDSFWGYDNSGSSNTPSNDAYRGPSAASEAETKMIKEFTIKHKFVMAISCHAYGKYLIHSWGYKAASTPDQNIFSSYGEFMTEENNYKVGTPSQTVGYTGNGSSSDWFYAEQTAKNKVLEFSPEAGSGSFYPAKNQILGICKEMFFSNYKAAKLVLKYVIAFDREQYYISEKSGYFNYSYKSLVPDAMAKFTVTIVPISPEITAVGTPKDYSNTAINKSLEDSISFTLVPSVAAGTSLKYILKISNGIFTHSDTIVKVYGNPTVVLAENGNSIDKWVSSSNWGVSTSVFHSASSSIADSPSGNYANSANSTITTKTALDLKNAKSALLSFWAKWDIEMGFDYAQLLASPDSGITWTPLCGKYTSSGTAKQDLNNPIYDGKQEWVNEQVNLDAFAGKRILLRFAFKSDAQNVLDGFYFDDLVVGKIENNSNGIKDAVSPAAVSLAMPNPANDYAYVNFKTANSTPAKLLVFDAMGRIIYTSENLAGTGNIKFNTSEWAPGIYYYYLQNGTANSAVHTLCITH